MARRGSPSLREIRAKGKKNRMTNDMDLLQIDDIYEKAASSKLTEKLTTGIVYHRTFALHLCPWDSEYPEDPERYLHIMSKIKEFKLLDRCHRITNRFATWQEITSLHNETLLDILAKTKEMNDENEHEFEKLASEYDAIYFNEHTYDAAHLAVGSVLNLVEAVLTGKVQNGMAIVRPPGHHAMANQFCGYCYFNNVALAANYALDKMQLKRVLIVDWDVHHGQGTQQMFYDDKRVMYFSIHRYENGTFWPNLRESEFDFIGARQGKCYNLNFPLNEIKCSDIDYLTIFTSILLPVAYEFNPELVLISAGYDAAIGCPEGRMKVTPGCYHYLTSLLMGLAKGRVVAVLEGGYFTHSLGDGAVQTLRALLGDPAPYLDINDTLKTSVRNTIYNLQSLLKRKWDCFRYLSLPWEGDGEDPRPSHKVIAKYVGKPDKAPFQTRNCYPKHSFPEKCYFIHELHRLRKSFYLNAPVLKVGYVSDSSMLMHVSPNANSFEKPERITRTLEILSELDLINRLVKINSRQVTDAELLLSHDKAYIKTIETISKFTESELIEKNGWPTVFTNEYTNSSARTSVGSLLNLVQAILDKQITSGLALIRPPGHHAEKDAAMGFCIFNNVAIAANYVREHSNLMRILIIDWDIHHGNGIQRAFYNTSSVLYISLHRHDDRKFFPFSEDGDIDKIGEGEGEGYNVNIPWRQGQMGDAEYLSAFHRVILPIAYEYEPELVIISAGFDACKGDPLGGYHVTPEAFGHFVQLIKPLAAGKIAIAIEGGYNVNSVAHSFAMCTKALLNDPLPCLSVNFSNMRSTAIETLNKVVEIHSKKWTTLLKDVRYEELSNSDDKRLMPN